MNIKIIKEQLNDYFSRIKPHLDVIIPWSYAFITFFFYYPYQFFFPFIYWFTIITYKNRVLHQSKYLNFKNRLKLKTMINSILLIPGIVFFTIFPLIWEDSTFDFYQEHLRFSCLRLHYLNSNDYFQYKNLDTPQSFSILTKKISSCHAYNATAFLTYAMSFPTYMTNPLSYPEHIFGERNEQAYIALKKLYPNLQFTPNPVFIPLDDSTLKTINH